MPKSVDKEVRFRVMRLLQDEPHPSPREISALTAERGDDAAQELASAPEDGRASGHGD